MIKADVFYLCKNSEEAQKLYLTFRDIYEKIRICIFFTNVKFLTITTKFPCCKIIYCNVPRCENSSPLSSFTNVIINSVYYKICDWYKTCEWSWKHSCCHRQISVTEVSFYVYSIRETCTAIHLRGKFQYNRSY